MIVDKMVGISLEVSMISADLGRQLEGFVSDLVEKGRYNSKSEVLREGVIKISSSDLSQIEAARRWIAGIVEEPEVGKVYTGKVVNIVDFGAFVNFMGGKDGLVHVSEMKNERVERPGDVVSEGQ